MQKKLLFVTASLVALGAAAPALAADLAARPYTKAPPMVAAAIYDWSGFYVGINGGYGSSHSCWNIAGFSDGCHDATGGTVGGQIGYRWQMGQLVFGVEGQGNWADLSGSNASFNNPGFSNTSRVDGFGLFTGQVGYAWNNVLLYAKGGAAVTGDRYSINDLTGAVAASTADDTRWGGTVGVGFEVTDGRQRGGEHDDPRRVEHGTGDQREDEGNGNERAPHGASFVRYPVFGPGHVVGVAPSSARATSPRAARR